MTVTVVATMKNEGAFLLEWAAHYLGLGASHLFIATNDCEDCMVEMVQRLAELGLATHHATRNTQGGGIQRTAYRQARWYPVVTEAEWILVCDSDEFLVIREGGLAELIARSPEADVIGLSWLNITNTGQIAYVDAPVTAQFTARQRGQKRNYTKYLARPASISRIGIHRPDPRDDLGRPFRRVMAGGAPWESTTLISRCDYTAAQMNHYPLRSLESFLVKRDRGRVNHTGEDMGLHYWERYSGAGRDTHLIRRHDATTAVWRARFAADTRLAALHDEAVRWHRDRIAALLARDDWREFLNSAAEISRQSRTTGEIGSDATTSPDPATGNT